MVAPLDYQPVLLPLSLGLVGALALSQGLRGATADAPPTLAPDPAGARRDADVMERLNALMVGEALHLDADLTLEQLSRRLRVPAKQLPHRDQSRERWERLLLRQRLPDPTRLRTPQGRGQCDEGDAE